MRLFRYASRHGGIGARLAAALEDGPAIDLLDAWNSARAEQSSFKTDWQSEGFLTSTAALIEAGPAIWGAVRDVIAAGAERSELRADASGEVHLLCPFDHVYSLRDFLAFQDHVEGGARRRGTDVPSYWYEAPIYYKGNHRALLGPDEECAWPSYTERLDFELELAMVIGRRGRDVSADDAANYIFGFTVFDDFSARDVQSRETSAWLGPGKGKDFANAFGPCIVTVDEVGPDPDLEMICRVNGEEWGRGRSGNARWSWRDMIAHVSRGEDIYPGDVYGSGTPGGCCGLDLDRWVAPGDVVELEIEGIGVLRNTIGPKSGS